MPSKQKTRRRSAVHIHTVQENIRRDEHQLCPTPGCRNVVAIWARQRSCSRCRKKGE